MPLQIVLQPTSSILHLVIPPQALSFLCKNVIPTKVGTGIHYFLSFLRKWENSHVSVVIPLFFLVIPAKVGTFLRKNVIPAKAGTGTGTGIWFYLITNISYYILFLTFVKR